MVLEGMVPVLMQTPPTTERDSTTATRFFILEAATAARWPEGPEPMTMRSYLAALMGLSLQRFDAAGIAEGSCSGKGPHPEAIMADGGRSHASCVNCARKPRDRSAWAAARRPAIQRPSSAKLSPTIGHLGQRFGVRVGDGLRKWMASGKELMPDGVPHGARFSFRESQRRRRDVCP